MRPSLAAALFAAAVAAAVSVACAAGASPGAAPDGPVAVNVRVPPLEDERLRRVGALRIEEVLVLSAGGLGGLSGLTVAADDSFAAVSDVGYAVRGRLVRDAGGRLTGVADVRRQTLFPDAAGRGGKSENDAEELTPTPDGGFLASFERNHRILRFGPDFAASGPPVRLPDPPGLRNAPGNGGIEAMAAWSDGAVMALQEQGDGETAPGWLSQGFPKVSADWRGFRYRPAPGFSPSGAVALPDGDALVLERRVGLLSGFSVRLALVKRGDAAAGGEVVGRELARLEPPGPSDNFEAVAVLPAAAGGFDVFLLSDDNFNPFQSTLLIRLSWPGSR